MPHKIFVTGGTGYLGGRLIPELAQRGHSVTALVRPGSEHKLPAAAQSVLGDALNGTTFASHVPGHDTFIQLVGVSHPSPSKAKEFVAIDQKSAFESIRVASESGIKHFVYVSVAHPAPAMHAYIEARTRCEQELERCCTTSPHMKATILRPWYILGPGHRWPYALLPFYWIAERIPSTRDGALRLGLVTIRQMIAALVEAVEPDADFPAARVRIMDVQSIRKCRSLSHGA